MADLRIAFDPSSSVSKAFYSLTDKFEPKLLFMDSDIIEVPLWGIKQYLSERIGTPSPVNEAWIEVKNKSYAVGFLAQQQFHSTVGLRQVKSQQLIYKLLAMVGLIAVNEGLPTQFSLELGILLPYGEYSDREYVNKNIGKALKSFKFRDKALSCTLEQFRCLPEGGGLLMRGIEGKIERDENVLIIMIGYRNASYLLQEKGQFKTGETTNLGMIRMLEMVQKSVSGVTPRDLVVPICQAGSEVNSDPIAQLIDTRQLLQSDKEVVKAIKAAQRQYWAMLKHWLKSAVFGEIDLVVFSGGTAFYYKNELESWWRSRATRLCWGQMIEKEVEKLVGEASINQWHYRLTDVYAYFIWLQYLFIAQKKAS